MPTGLPVSEVSFLGGLDFSGSGSGFGFIGSGSGWIGGCSGEGSGITGVGSVSGVGVVTLSGFGAGPTLEGLKGTIASTVFADRCREFTNSPTRSSRFTVEVFYAVVGSVMHLCNLH